MLYWQKLCTFGSKKTEKEKKKTWNLWFHILVACIPAGILGVLFDDIIDEYLYTPLVIALALIVYGVLFIIIENRDLSLKYKKVEQIDYSTSFKIGMFQCLALVPGTSRSGSTILGGRLLGCSKESVSEFSFFVAIPIMAGASLLKLIKAGFGFGLSEWIVLLVGTFTAFIVSIFAIKFLLSYIRKHDFKAFGIYRIVLGILVILYFYVIS